METWIEPKFCPHEPSGAGDPGSPLTRTITVRFSRTEPLLRRDDQTSWTFRNLYLPVWDSPSDITQRTHEVAHPPNTNTHHSLSLSLTLSLSHSLTHSLTHSLSHSLSLTHSLTHSLSLSLSLSLSHIHTYIHHSTTHVVLAQVQEDQCRRLHMSRQHVPVLQKIAELPLLSSALASAERKRKPYTHSLRDAQGIAARYLCLSKCIRESLNDLCFGWSFHSVKNTFISQLNKGKVSRPIELGQIEHCSLEKQTSDFNFGTTTQGIKWEERITQWVWLTTEAKFVAQCETI